MGDLRNAIKKLRWSETRSILENNISLLNEYSIVHLSIPILLASTRINGFRREYGNFFSDCSITLP